MEAKLYVGNLPYSTVDADLQTLFSQAGTVKSAQVIRDRASGRSKGFGFVEMSSAEEAQSAITMFHGKDFSGRPLTVNLARPREERPAGGGFRSGGGRRPGGNGDRERRREY
jgi:RNA recognition motif-containing protein